LLNLFYSGQLKAMSPKLRSDDGRHVVIRPLIYCEERDLVAYSELKQFPIIPCNLCGSQENLKRNEMKTLLREWEKRHPGRVETMLNSLKHVRSAHLLDRSAFDFDRLPPSRAGAEIEL
jgi:tRNA 2-thiocytidine biosynthesis protein TtcA